MYETGLIVGKFCPLHKGHRLLIDTAMAQCQTLVIISYAKPAYAHCDVQNRRDWLKELYPQAIRLVVDDDWVSLNGDNKWLALPYDDDDESLHRQFTAWLCFDYLKQTPDAVFTSETYGTGFAKALEEYISKELSINHQVDHISVDQARKAVPISATIIRQSPYEYRLFLEEYVYRSFIKRIVCLGGESTGKSTLCKALAERLGTVWAAEYGREIWENQNGNLDYEDMLKIAQQQIKRENNLLYQSNVWLVCDTSPLTTKLYSDFMFGKHSPELNELAARPYDLIFLCDDDFDFVQDGTRQDADFRKQQQQYYKAELQNRGLPYILLKGDLESRIETALNAINEPTSKI